MAYAMPQPKKTKVGDNGDNDDDPGVATSTISCLALSKTHCGPEFEDGTSGKGETREQRTDNERAKNIVERGRGAAWTAVPICGLSPVT